MRPRRGRTYRTPVVITLTALGPACVPGLPDDSTGGHASGGGVSYAECPADDGSDVNGFPFAVPCTPSGHCQIEMDCTSGTQRAFVFTCAASGDRWTSSREECPYRAEFCSRGWDAVVCEDDGWMYQGQGGNPPAPCPEALPEEGGECTGVAAFGGDRAACGYPCADGTGWTVTGCVAEMTDDQQYPFGPGTWQSDGACSVGGQGGAGP